MNDAASVSKSGSTSLTSIVALTDPFSSLMGAPGVHGTGVRKYDLNLLPLPLRALNRAKHELTIPTFIVLHLSAAGHISIEHLKSWSAQ